MIQPNVPKMPSSPKNDGEKLDSTETNQTKSELTIGYRNDEMPDEIKKAYEIYEMLCGLKRDRAIRILSKTKTLIEHYSNIEIQMPDIESEGWWYPL